jgi:hypothetical protein
MLTISTMKTVGIGFGKHFASMYTGSMYGAGAMMFAVMGYVVANMVPVGSDGMQVELNPKMLKHVLGESEDDVVKTIRALCSPDPRSRSKAEEGRRLVKTGEFEYRVVNGPKYRAIRAAESRREQNAKAQARYREKKAAQKLSQLQATPIDGMTQLDKLQQKAEENGDESTVTRCKEIRDEVAPGTYEKDEDTPF